MAGNPPQRACSKAQQPCASGPNTTIKVFSGPSSIERPSSYRNHHHHHALPLRERETQSSSSICVRSSHQPPTSRCASTRRARGAYSIERGAVSQAKCFTSRGRSLDGNKRNIVVGGRAAMNQCRLISNTAAALAGQCSRDAAASSCSKRIPVVQCPCLPDEQRDIQGGCYRIQEQAAQRQQLSATIGTLLEVAW